MTDPEHKKGFNAPNSSSKSTDSDKTRSNEMDENLSNSTEKTDSSSIRKDFRLINGSDPKETKKEDKDQTSPNSQSKNPLSTYSIELPEGLNLDDLVELEESPESLAIDEENQSESNEKQVENENSADKDNVELTMEDSEEAPEANGSKDDDVQLEENNSLNGDNIEAEKSPEPSQNNANGSLDNNTDEDGQEIPNETSSNNDDVEMEDSPEPSNSNANGSLANNNEANNSDDDIVELDVSPSTSRMSMQKRISNINRLLPNSRLSSSHFDSSLQYIDINRLKPDFAISLFSTARVKEFLDMLHNGTFRIEETVFKVHPMEKDSSGSSKFQIISGSHRFMAFKKWNHCAKDPIDKIQCQVYSNHLSYAERVACLTGKDAVEDSYFTLGQRAEITRQMYEENQIQDKYFTKTERREVIQRLYEQTFSKSKYHIVIASFVFLSDLHWDIVKETMQKFEDGIIMQYSDRPNNSKYKGEHGKPEICASFFLEFFRAYKHKPNLAINILQSMKGTEKSLTWALDRFKSVGHTLKETLEDLKITGYHLEDPPDINRASMFFVGRLMNEQELCECLRNPRTMGKIKRRITRPAALIAANLKAQLTSSTGFSTLYSSISDIKSANDRCAIIFEHYGFEDLLTKFLGKFVAIFIGDKSYLSYVKGQMGEPHLTVETRINLLKPMAHPEKIPTNVNSGVYIYLMETQRDRMYPNRELFYQMIWDHQVPMASFMNLNELANPIQLLDPKQLLVINPPEHLAREIFTMGRVIGTLNTIEIACDSETDASQMAMQIQDLCLEQGQDVGDFSQRDAKKQSLGFGLNMETSNSIIDISDDEMDASEQSNNQSVQQLKEKSTVCKPFVIVCSPPRLAEKPLQNSRLSNNAIKRPLNPQLGVRNSRPGNSSFNSPNTSQSRQKRIFHVAHQRTPQPMGSQLSSTNPNITRNNGEVQQHCTECGVIGPITPNGFCESCHVKKFGEECQIIQVQSQKLPCAGCRNIRLMFKQGYCRKCYTNATNTMNAINAKAAKCGKEFQCSLCMKVKKHFAKGMCAACYQRVLSRPKVLAKQRAQKAAAQEQEQQGTLATMEELLNLCGTSYADTSDNSSDQGEIILDDEPPRKQSKVAANISLEQGAPITFDGDTPILNLNELLMQMGDNL